MQYRANAPHRTCSILKARHLRQTVIQFFGYRFHVYNLIKFWLLDTLSVFLPFSESKTKWNTEILRLQYKSFPFKKRLFSRITQIWERANEYLRQQKKETVKILLWNKMWFFLKKTSSLYQCFPFLFHWTVSSQNGISTLCLSVENANNQHE